MLTAVLRLIFSRSAKWSSSFIVGMFKTLLGGKDPVGRLTGRLGLAFIAVFGGMTVYDSVSQPSNSLRAYSLAAESYKAYTDLKENSQTLAALVAGDKAFEISRESGLFPDAALVELMLDLAKGHQSVGHLSPEHWKAADRYYSEALVAADAPRAVEQREAPDAMTVVVRAETLLNLSDLSIQLGQPLQTANRLMTTIDFLESDIFLEKGDERQVMFRTADVIYDLTQDLESGSTGALTTDQAQALEPITDYLVPDKVRINPKRRVQDKESLAAGLLNLMIEAFTAEGFEKQLSHAYLQRGKALFVVDDCASETTCPRSVADAHQGLALALDHFDAESLDMFQAKAQATRVLFDGWAKREAADLGEETLVLGEALRINGQDLTNPVERSFLQHVSLMFEILNYVGRSEKADQLRAKYPASEDVAPRLIIQKDGFAIVPIFYGTSREPTGQTKSPPFYKGNPSEEAGERGRIEVTIPTGCSTKRVKVDGVWVDQEVCPHKVGKIEEPIEMATYDVPMSGGELDLKRSVTARDLQVYARREDFYSALSSEVDLASESGKKQVFIFVHGYNTRFEDAAKRVGQIAYDIKFQGVPMLYSWPSRGSPLTYLRERRIPASVQADMQLFFEEVIEKSGAEQIHVIAHSMGNHYLLSMLEDWDRVADPKKPVFDEMIFAAADVDGEWFEDLAGDLRKWSKRRTLYSSQHDDPLDMSQIVNFGKRAGDADPVTIAEGVDTIDASEAFLGFNGNGHSYFSQDPSMLTDMRALMWHSLDAKSRCVLTQRTYTETRFWFFKGEERKYWQYQPDEDKCPPFAFDQTAVLVADGGVERALERADQKIQGAHDELATLAYQMEGVDLDDYSEERICQKSKHEKKIVRRWARVEWIVNASFANDREKADRVFAERMIIPSALSGCPEPTVVAAL